ncbi:putative receptor-like protein kinase [Dorcoceras hygrometricum]|uniref:Putative receptor-like protein kinase n=1 Tax=Dorcoceras hygrometricum TaxID=472368 RepID=A0A2Z7BGP1_9LAMI|nr:putative receptor-like protein kinase [Dorcoceras hygrometricum]
MSLFGLQDVCIAIGSLATLDLPMVVDLIGIYGLKGPYSLNSAAPSPQILKPPPPPPLFAGKSFPANLDEENPSAQISSGLLVQVDEGIPSPVVDLIDDIYRRLP